MTTHACPCCGKQTEGATDSAGWRYATCQECHDGDRMQIGPDALGRRVTPEHVTDGSPCWCVPVVERYEYGDVIIHREPEEMD